MSLAKAHLVKGTRKDTYRWLGTAGVPGANQTFAQRRRERILGFLSRWLSGPRSSWLRLRMRRPRLMGVGISREADCDAILVVDVRELSA
jgi:hypothetical protein